MKHLTNGIILSAIIALAGCDNEKDEDIIKFATSAEYPPFEYHEGGEVKGFDIELATLIAKDLGKKAVFENMQFSTILPTLDSGFVDAAISTITITDDRQKNFDFSDPYYAESMAVVFLQDKPVNDSEQLSGKKVACQMGSTMEIWAKKHIPLAEIVTFDGNNQSIEALKAGHVEVALVDGSQGAAFSQKNPGLSYSIIGKSDTGYGVAFKKGSSLKEQVNQSLKKLESIGEIKKLEKKWLVAEK